MKIVKKNIHQSYFVVAGCVGVIAGTVVGLVGRVNYFTSPLWIGFVVGLLILAYFKPKMIFLVIAFVAGMILAFLRVSHELMGENYIRQFYGQTVVVSGEIDGDPETDEKGTSFKVKDLRFGENGEYESAGNLFISEYRNEDLARGDKITLKGKMAEGFGAYAGYMYKPNIVNWARPEPGNLVVLVRNWFAERVRGLMPEPEVNLGLSYLLGMRSGLPDDLNDNLRTVGLVHIVVASGAHLSILVEIARKIFGKVSRFAGLLFSIIFIVFFMAMVGWTPSIMRAGIMAILTVMAWYVGRKIAPWRIILMVAAGTLVVNPMFVINLGWLLSFASFAGIMILGPRMAKYFYGSKKPGFIAEIIITTISATLMTLPIILYFYGQVSLISVVANLLILPTLPYAMGLVFLTGVVAGLPGVEMVVSWCATKLLDFHIVVVSWFGGMEQFLVKIEPYQIWVWGIYVGIAVMMSVGVIRKRVWRGRVLDNGGEKW